MTVTMLTVMPAICGRRNGPRCIVWRFSTTLVKMGTRYARLLIVLRYMLIRILIFKWRGKIEKGANNSVRCRAKHRVEGGARSQIDTAQKAYNHCHTYLCIQGHPESRADSGPAGTVSVLSNKVQLLLCLHFGKWKAIVTSKSPKHSPGTWGLI